MKAICVVYQKKKKKCWPSKEKENGDFKRKGQIFEILKGKKNQIIIIITTNRVFDILSLTNHSSMKVNI